TREVRDGDQRRSPPMTRAEACSLLAAAVLLVPGQSLAQDAGVPPGDAAVPKQQVSIWDLDVVENDGKYSIEGSVFAIGDPVHEAITLLALRESGVLAANASAAQYLRGVFWNDDPCAQLFSGNHAKPLDPSYGISWLLDFKKGGKTSSTSPDFPDLVCPLLGRSHFGDLQFLHGMANADGVAAADTRALIMAWAQFTYGVATGKIKARAKLETSAPAIYAALARSARYQASDLKTAAALFRSGDPKEVQRRALGSLLHTIQDSYAAGHTDRVITTGTQRGSIRQFRSYTHQDHKKHAADDAWKGGDTDRQRIALLSGGESALNACVQLLQHFKNGDDWARVEADLKDTTFAMTDDAAASGPGTAYATKKP
ncbi:MAG TPA: hypothetical protein VI299_15460, partial [Polyangiales bacterium]